MGVLVWPSIEERLAGAPPRWGSKEERAHEPEAGVPAAVPPIRTSERTSIPVIIGVDLHKATHIAVALSSDEQELASKKVRSGGHEAEHLLAWAEPFEARTWAIESAGGLGSDGQLRGLHPVRPSPVRGTKPSPRLRHRSLRPRAHRQQRLPRRVRRRAQTFTPG
jgi:hypothetical protein